MLTFNCCGSGQTHLKQNGNPLLIVTSLSGVSELCHPALQAVITLIHEEVKLPDSKATLPVRSRGQMFVNTRVLNIDSMYSVEGRGAG